jgi:hypothetical protein
MTNFAYHTTSLEVLREEGTERTVIAVARSDQEAMNIVYALNWTTENHPGEPESLEESARAVAEGIRTGHESPLPADKQHRQAAKAQRFNHRMFATGSIGHVRGRSPAMHGEYVAPLPASGHIDLTRCPMRWSYSAAEIAAAQPLRAEIQNVTSVIGTWRARVLDAALEVILADTPSDRLYLAHNGDETKIMELAPGEEIRIGELAPGTVRARVWTEYATRAITQRYAGPPLPGFRANPEKPL